MYKLNKWQEMWLQALESGEYAQSKGCLYDGEGFCCLGVACDVLGMTGVEEESGVYSFDGCKNTAPDKVVRALKLRNQLGLAERNFKTAEGQFEALVYANDTGVTFKQIARAIRKNPENFFRR